MKNQKIITLSLAATFAATAFAPMTALADGASQQKNKNQWRNLGAGAAAIAGYGLLKGDPTTTILGAAGAAYSANRYEQDRKSQDEAKRARARYYHRGDHVSNGRKYYKYNGHMYYMDLSTGARHQID